MNLLASQSPSLRKGTRARCGGCLRAKRSDRSRARGGKKKEGVETRRGMRGLLSCWRRAFTDLDGVRLKRAARAQVGPGCVTTETADGHRVACIDGLSKSEPRGHREKKKAVRWNRLRSKQKGITGRRCANGTPHLKIGREKESGKPISNTAVGLNDKKKRINSSNHSPACKHRLLPRIGPRPIKRDLEKKGLTTPPGRAWADRIRKIKRGAC